jgi:hypothetical protein
MKLLFISLMLLPVLLLAQNSPPIDADLLGEDIATCDRSVVIHAPQLQGAHYLWSTGATTDFIEVDSPGGYQVVMTLPDGSQQRDWIWVTMYFRYFPTFLSYNCGHRGGYDPECLSFETPHPEEYTLRVFDRWGNLQLDASSPDMKWCPFEDHKTSEGVYFYVLETLDCEGNPVEFKSDIIFMR